MKNSERMIGAKAYGIRLPIISNGDNLPEIIAESINEATVSEGINLSESDVIGITEAVVAKAQGNYASINDISADIRQKFPDGELGLVFPILSRNRFMNILKGIAHGADKLNVLLQYPADEVGNPLMEIDKLDEIEDILRLEKPLSAARFKELAGDFVHPFTGIDYISMYEGLAPNISVYLSDDPRDILKLTKNVLVCEIHSRERTKARLIKAGAEKVYCLSDVLAFPESGDKGYNPQYGVLGSNIANDDTLKLFPRDCKGFVAAVRECIRVKTGISPEVLVYGDGAFKDPEYGIWELADPIVSPAYTARLGGLANELKLKYVADNALGGMDNDSKRRAITDIIKEKKQTGVLYDELAAEGTTPRKFANLLGSLCDLMSGSGDKGTPVVLIKGYFDDYSDE